MIDIPREKKGSRDFIKREGKLRKRRENRTKCEERSRYVRSAACEAKRKAAPG